MTKEELIAQRAKIARQLEEIERTEKIEAAKPLVGNCYRISNSYSRPAKRSDYWWLYRKVVAVTEEGWLKVWSFQECKDRRFEANFQLVFNATQNLGGQISQEHYEKAWTKFIDRLSKAYVDAETEEQ